MTRTRSPGLACSLALLFALLHPLLSSPARALAILASHGHGHGLAVVADSGHLDVVLSHAATEAPETHAAERHLHASPDSGEDHVLHLAGADVKRDSLRRTLDAPATGLELAPGRSPAPRAVAPRTRAHLAQAPPRVLGVVLRI